MCGKKALRLRALPPHRHRHRPLGPPAGLPQRRPLAGLGQGPRLRPGRTDRGLHRLHDLRHQRRQDPAGSAETARRLAQRDDQRGPLPGRTRAQLRLHDAGRGRRSGAGIPRRRDHAGGESGPAPEPRRSRSRQEEHKKQQAEARSRSRRSRRSKWPSPAATAWCPAARSRRSRGEDRRPARLAASSRSTTRPGFRKATRFVESDPYEKVVDPYVYNLKDEDGNRHVAYRMVLVAEMSDGTHYFGVQGIRGWSDPPILDDPSLTKTIHGRDYDIYVDGENVKMVAWRRGENVYWVSNDLLRTLTNDQMIGMARSAKVLVPSRRRSSRSPEGAGDERAEGHRSGSSESAGSAWSRLPASPSSATRSSPATSSRRRSSRSRAAR